MNHANSSDIRYINIIIHDSVLTLLIFRRHVSHKSDTACNSAWGFDMGLRAESCVQ